MIKQILSIFVCCLATCYAVCAQQSIQVDSAKQNKLIKDLKFTAYPIVFSLPETSWGFGAAGVSTFRTKGSSAHSKPSTIQLAAVYTLKKQILIFTPFDLQFNNNRTRVHGEIGYFRYFFNYFGRGIRIAPNTKETYKITFPRLIFNVEQSIRGPHFIGLKWSYDHYSNPEFKKFGLLESSKPLGYEMGVSTGMGIGYRFDTRDNYFYPTKGVYALAEVFYNTKILGSDYKYLRYTITSSFFQKIYRTHILGVLGVGQSSSKNTPFFDLPYLGKPTHLRGYSDRKFSDNQLIAFQAEYRFPIFWRFRGVLFGGTGTVFNQFQDFSNSIWKWSYGAGLRIVLNKKEHVHVRIDYGIG